MIRRLWLARILKATSEGQRHALNTQFWAVPSVGGPWAVQLQKKCRLGGYGRFTQDTDGY